MSEKAKRSIKGKLLGGVLVLGVLMTAVFAVLITISHQKYLELNATRAVENSARVYDAVLLNDTRMMSATLDAFTQIEEYKKAFNTGEQKLLYTATEALFRANRERYGITHLSFMGPDGETYLRMHKREQFGDMTTRITFQKARDQRRMASGIDLGKNGFALRVITPYYFDEHEIGFVEFGKEIDRFDSLLKLEAGVEVAILIEKQYFQEADYRSLQKANNKRDAWDDLAGHVVMSTTLEDNDFVTKKLYDPERLKTVKGPTRMGTVSLGGKTFVRGAFPLRDVSEKVIGSVIVLSDVTDIVRGEQLALAAVLGIGLLLLGITTWFTYRYLDQSIIRPLTELTAKATEISMGKVDDKLVTDREDEIGLLIRSFERMRASLKKSIEMLQGE